jgi:hypothetical protein
VPSESIASHPSRVGSAEPCAGCGAALASDQRYCLECGERRAPISSVLLGGTEPASSPQSGHASTPPTPPGPLLEPGQSSAGGAPRGNTVTVIAGVGVLLLAMGVGVLIGRSGGTQPAASAPQVISVASGPATGTSTSQSAPFTDDWPSGTDGYTIRLQALPQASTQADAVGAAKAEARAKGAKGVGALKSEDFSSLKAGSYIVYSGVYPKQAEAQKALAGLKKSFPHATVIKVSSSGPAAAGASPGAGSGSGAAGGGAGSSPPASSKVLEDLHKSKGKSYEEKSKNLPNQVET